jgi:hypothetical protein
MVQEKTKMGRGRSTKSSELTRVRADLVEKIGWIGQVKGISSSDFVSALIESKVNDVYAEIEPIVEQIKAEREKGKTDDEPSFANELGEAGA